MDVSQAQIDDEFQRQVYLCSGLGETRMLAIVRDHFSPKLMCKVCPHPVHARACLRCGCGYVAT